MDSDVYSGSRRPPTSTRAVPAASGSSSHMATAIDIVGAAQGAGRLPELPLHGRGGRAARWTDFAQGHELYRAGHLFQAAVAHHRATGTDDLLRIARRFADGLVDRFGPGKHPRTPGHPGDRRWGSSELYRETGDRVTSSSRGSPSISAGTPWLGPGRYNSAAYYQTASRSARRIELEGHAVRALYLDRGHRGRVPRDREAALLSALHRQWADPTSRQALRDRRRRLAPLGEAFGQPYELPNDLAYDDVRGDRQHPWSCACCSRRARALRGSDRPAPSTTRSCPGVSLDGGRYFLYVNPLASNGRAEYLGRGGCLRKEWHLVACCPPNAPRLLASLGHYVATRDGDRTPAHQYAPAGSRPALRRRPGCRPASGRTRYPWRGAVRLTVERRRALVAARPRIPGGASRASR